MMIVPKTDMNVEEEFFLEFLAALPRHPIGASAPPVAERVRQRCNARGWVRYDRQSRKWILTPAGRKALQGGQGLRK